MLVVLFFVDALVCIGCHFLLPLALQCQQFLQLQAVYSNVFRLNLFHFSHPESQNPETRNNRRASPMVAHRGQWSYRPASGTKHLTRKWKNSWIMRHFLYLMCFLWTVDIFISTAVAKYCKAISKVQHLKTPESHECNHKCHFFKWQVPSIGSIFLHVPQQSRFLHWCVFLQTFPLMLSSGDGNTYAFSLIIDNYKVVSCSNR